MSMIDNFFQLMKFVRL